MNVVSGVLIPILPKGPFIHWIRFTVISFCILFLFIDYNVMVPPTLSDFNPLSNLTP